MDLVRLPPFKLTINTSKSEFTLGFVYYDFLDCTSRIVPITSMWSKETKTELVSRKGIIYYNEGYSFQTQLTCKDFFEQRQCRILKGNRFPLLLIFHGCRSTCHFKYTIFFYFTNYLLFNKLHISTLRSSIWRHLKVTSFQQ